MSSQFLPVKHAKGIAGFIENNCQIDQTFKFDYAALNDSQRSGLV